MAHDEGSGLEALRRVLAARVGRPRAFVDATEIPWSDPELGRRYLRVGRKDDDDTIHELAFIASVLELAGDEAVLDVMCGDGRVALPLARDGHPVLGVDINPTAIAVAQEAALRAGLTATARFVCADARSVALACEHDVALFIYGHLSGFPRPEAVEILRRAGAALRPGGRVLVDLHLGPAYVRELDGQQEWALHADGWLGTDRPALVLDEYFTDAEALTFVRRSYCVDLEAGSVQTFAQAGQFYDEVAIDALLTDAGLELDELWGDFDGQTYDDDASPNLIALARR